MIEKVIDGMRSFTDDVPLQRCSAAILADFAAFDGDLKSHIVKMEGVPLIFKAITMRDSGDSSDDDQFQTLVAEFSSIF